MSEERRQATVPVLPASLVEAARDATHRDRDAAWCTIQEKIEPIVRATIRRAVDGPELTQELTQSYFAHVLFRRDLLGRAKPMSCNGEVVYDVTGLVLKSVRQYLVDHWRREEADRRRLETVGKTRGGSLGDDDRRDLYAQVASHLQAAMSTTAAHFCNNRRPHFWRAYEAWVVHPAVNGTAAPPLSKIAADFGFESANQMSHAVHTVRTFLAGMLIDRISAETRDNERETLLELLGEYITIETGER